MKRLVFWLITIGVVIVGYLTYDANPFPKEYATLAPPAGILNSPDAIAQGRTLFVQECAACHGTRGDSHGALRTPFGPPPANFTDRLQTAKRSPQYLFWRISEGGHSEPFRARGSIMPAWKYQLPEQQRWQLVSYLTTLAQ